MTVGPLSHAARPNTAQPALTALSAVDEVKGAQLETAMSDTMTVGEALIATVDQAAADVRLAREKSDATLSAGVNGLTIAQQLAIQKSLSETTVGMTLLSTGVKTVENTVEQVTKGG